MPGSCKKIIVGFCVALASSLASLAANAQSFQGSTWTLGSTGGPLADSDPLHETYRIILGVDLSGYYGGGLFLDEVSIRVSSGPLYAGSLYDAPGSASSWILQVGAINSYDCSGVGSSFACADSTLLLSGGNGVPVSDLNPSGTDYQWVFDLSMDNGTLLTGALESTIKARFVDASGNLAGSVVAESITLAIPEPETYAMLLAGLGLMAFVARRRTVQALG